MTEKSFLIISVLFLLLSVQVAMADIIKTPPSTDPWGGTPPTWYHNPNAMCQIYSVWVVPSNTTIPAWQFYHRNKGDAYGTWDTRKL